MPAVSATPRNALRSCIGRCSPGDLQCYDTARGDLGPGSPGTAQAQRMTSLIFPSLIWGQARAFHRALQIQPKGGESEGKGEPRLEVTSWLCLLRDISLRSPSPVRVSVKGSSCCFISRSCLGQSGSHPTVIALSGSISAWFLCCTWPQQKY